MGALQRFDLWALIARDADGGVGGLGAAAGDGKAVDPKAGDAGGDKGGAGDGKGGEGKADPYFPEGLDAAWKGANDRETLDKIAAHLKGLPKPPASADAYKLDLPPDFVKAHGDLKGDPVVAIFNRVALKHRLDNTQHNGVITDLYAEMEKEGLIEKPIDLDAEFASLSDGKGDPAANIAGGKKVVLALRDEIGALVTRKAIPKEVGDLLGGAMLADANHVRAISSLVALLPKAKGLEAGGDGKGDGQTDHERSIRRMYPTMVIT